MSNPNFPTLSTAELTLMKEALDVAVSAYLECGLTDKAMAVMDLVGDVIHGEPQGFSAPEPRKRLGQHVGRV